MERLPSCEHLALRYDLELVMVKRQAGDLICASELKTAIICLEDVLTYHHIHHIPLHEAFTRYGTTWASCAFCILSSLHNLIQSASCLENHDNYWELVELETVSTFSFQEGRGLGDSAPHLLSEEGGPSQAERSKTACHPPRASRDPHSQAPAFYQRLASDGAHTI